jgi:DNA helicase II / ATP-dependent DNA helicase PcrA
MAIKIDYESSLNEEQRAPVLAGDGPMLVIAAAGTGKTRTLTYRVARLVEQGCDPRGILLLTFTNKAAAEMLERARGLVGDMVSGLWGGTFHHMANRMLSIYAQQIGYRGDYSIIDRDDSKKLVRDCVERLQLGGKHFPKPNVLLSMFGLADNMNGDLEELVRERFEHNPVEPEDILAVRRLYQERKLDMNVMDFDDLLLNAWRLLKENEAVRERYQEQFQNILVDEYQDTNPIQAGIVDLLAARRRNLMVVGDDFQSIYSWRGADFRNIMSFPERYPEARVFKLETNYRSVPEVLAVANACIKGNPGQFQKTLRAMRQAHCKPSVATLRDGRQQADYIIDKIAGLRRQGRPLRDMVVIYRSHFHALELQLELARARLPYTITSGIRFFEQAHIKDVCTLLRLINNPADEVSFLRLLTLLPRVGDKSALRIWQALGDRFNPLISEQRDLIASKLPAPAKEGWRKIAQVFDGFKQESLNEDFGEVIYRFTASFYEDYAAETFDNNQRRIEDIEELSAYTAKHKDLQEFLAEIALISNLDAEDEGVAAADGAVDSLRLTTIHQAKGLEWETVFIIWLADGMFPARRSIEDPANEAEERRLFYVATTRAKDLLYLCYPRMHRARGGDAQYYAPSRFLEELPRELLEKEPFFF